MTLVTPRPGQVHFALGGFLQVRVEVDSGLDPAGGGLYDVDRYDTTFYGTLDPAWQDVTPYVQEITINRGAARWGEMFETGSCQLVVQNITGIFTPDSGMGGFHQPFHPGRKIRVICLPDPEDPLNKEPLFTGIIDASNDSYAEGGYDINTIITAQDFMSQWAAHDPLPIDPPTGKQLTSVRVDRILDEMDWPEDEREIQTGTYQMMSSVLADNSLTELQNAAWAEGGHVFCDRHGNAVFKSRDWLSNDPRSTEVQGWLGFDQVPAGSQAGMVTNITPSWERARIVNQVKFARSGDPGQFVYDDFPSQQRMGGVRTFQKLDFQHTTNAPTQALAQRYLAQYRDSKMRVDGVTFNGQDDPDNDDLNWLMYGTEFGDMLAVKVTTPYGWEIIRFPKVFGIAHHITGEDWQVTLRLDDVFTNRGGSIFDLEIVFDGEGQNPTRQGGSELDIHAYFTGGAAVSKAGGSELPLRITYE